MALTTSKPPPAASGQPRPHDPAVPVATTAAAHPTTVTTSSAAPTTAATTTKATVTTTVAPTHSRSGGGPMPPPVPPPTSATVKLTYVSITRFHNTKTGFHMTETTDSSLPAQQGFVVEGGLGYLVTTNAPGTVGFYLCKTSAGDYFSSVDQTGRCEGQTTVGLLGYVYLDAPASGPSAPLYRCNANGATRYDSLNSACENNGTNEGRLGYVI